MTDFDKEPEDCDHDDLEYYGMDVSQPGTVYENWICTGCGADVDRVYKPSHELVFHPEQDEVVEREVDE